MARSESLPTRLGAVRQTPFAPPGGRRGPKSSSISDLPCKNGENKSSISACDPEFASSSLCRSRIDEFRLFVHSKQGRSFTFPYQKANEVFLIFASCADSCTTRSADRGAVGLRDHFRPLAPALQGLRKDTGLISALGPKRTLLKALTLELRSLSLANELNEKFSAPLGKGSGGEVPAAN